MYYIQLNLSYNTFPKYRWSCILYINKEDLIGWLFAVFRFNIGSCQFCDEFLFYTIVFLLTLPAPVFIKPFEVPQRSGSVFNTTFWKVQYWTLEVEVLWNILRPFVCLSVCSFVQSFSLKPLIEIFWIFTWNSGVIQYKMWREDILEKILSLDFWTKCPN